MSRGLPNQIELTAARVVVGEHHPHTPLYRLENDDWGGIGEIYVKYENHGPVRSFKARGALFSVWRLSADERTRGVVTASTGNHGRGIAYAGAAFGIPVTVVVPDSAPVVKTRPIERLGADLRVVEGNLLRAQEAARAIAAEAGSLYLEDGEDPGLMAGASTVAAEILEDLPEVGTIVVPVGGGNLIAGIALWAKNADPRIRIVGVQSEAAPSVVRSWEAGVVTAAPCETFAGGLATSTPGHLAFDVIKELVDDMILVSEEDLEGQIVRILKSTGEVAEGAGAAAFAALAAYPREWPGKTVLVLTGGNIEFSDLRRLVMDDGRSSN
jgi:threonine dehydratase